MNASRSVQKVMRSLIPPELTLDCSLSPKISLPKSTGEILLEVSGLRNASEKISKLEDHVNRLHAEMKKIEGFRRELPLCMILVADAIATVKKEIIQCGSSIAEPIMEEFMPLKKTSTDEKDDKVEEKNATNNSRDKMSWMSSVQLWNSGNNQQHPHHRPNTENVNNLNSPAAKRDSNKKRKEELINGPTMDDLFPSGKNRKIEKAFEPLKGCSVFPGLKIGKEGINEMSGVTELSLLTPEFTPETKNSKEEIYTNGFCSKTSSSRGSSSPTNGQSIVKEQSTRKQRRCWSPELHCRFVSALQRLGGPQATPKQIRELMQIDGLTNDEVKSHLQKYRLHNRKATQTANSSPIDLGGLWVSQEHCGESSKPINSQSGSPQGPLNLNGAFMVTSITGTDSMEDEEEEEEEDEKSQDHLWKGHNHLSKRVVDV